MRRRIILTMLVGAALAAPLAHLAAQSGPPATPAEARAALDSALRQQRSARERGKRLEAEAARADRAATRALAQSAALAARVQQAEAAIAAAEARLVLVNDRRRRLDADLAARRQPLVALTAALGSMARRPVVLAAFQPGSLSDLVHTRAVLAAGVPAVARRTEALRGDLAQARALEREAALALADRRAGERDLAARRAELVSRAAAQRLLAQNAAGASRSEARRALGLSEKARDLSELVAGVEAAAGLRAELAALPGPVLRPADPGAARGAPKALVPVPTGTQPPARYQLPVAGTVVRGFGALANGARSQALVLAARPRAQVVAPGAGRVAFAGPYRGYGRIVIVDHGKGWTSLVTGLATLDVAPGEDVTAGSPLGTVGGGAAQIALELRASGEAVNPLDHLQ